MEHPDLRPAAQRVADLVAAVRPDQLGDPTPCPQYAVGDLVEHIGGLALAFTAAAGKELGGETQGAPVGDAARLPDDWPTRIPQDLEALAVAWQDPEAWTGMTQAGSVDLPGDIAGLVALDELVVHGWDLARATGQPYDPDGADLEAVEGFLAGFGDDREAGPDAAFGPPVDVTDDASALDRVVALSGRDPAWRSE
jgi:uncharacterized protein (TIGR03086 family)